MSAHCENCGTDLVYGRGENWQLMTCPVCSLREENQRFRDALTKVVWVAPFNSDAYAIALEAIRKPSAAQTLEETQTTKEKAGS